MKNILYGAVVIIFIFIIFSFTDHNVETHSLTIKVNELRNLKGVVQFTLYNKEGSIPDEDYEKYYKIGKGAIINGSASITIHNLPSGKYAVNILHDENLNGKIDKGFILPIEGIGFSNFQTIGFANRPNFSKASFDLKENKTVTVRVIYM